MDYTQAQIDGLFRRRFSYSKGFGGIVSHMMNEGIISQVEQVGEAAYSAEISAFWSMNSLCREAASVMQKGMFSEIGNGQGIKWSMGNMTAGVLLKHEYVAPVKAAQAVVGSIIPAAQMLPECWTSGGNARRLLRYALDVNVTQKGTSEVLLKQVDDTSELPPTQEELEASYQYHDCIPGKYSRVIMWDAEAYYFNWICRLPSLKLSFTRGGIDWKRMSETEVGRWAEVKAHIGNTKLLRNSLWGVLLGSSTPKVFYTSTVKEGEKPGAVRMQWFSYTGGGIARPAALLSARSAAEMCSEAAQETSSIYSTMDSVTTLGTGFPNVWKNNGFPCRIKEEGDVNTDGIGGEIVSKGVWKMGKHHTETYHNERDLPKDFTCKVEPSFRARTIYEMRYYPLWLDVKNVEMRSE